MSSEITHYIIEPSMEFDTIELLLNIAPCKESDSNIIISKPVYKNSFSYGSYHIRQPKLGIDITVLSQVQQLLDLARLLPTNGYEDEIESRISDISKGLERKYYP